jgi:hypothetical protein
MATQDIQWLKFAEQLRERYALLLNLDLCLQIAEDAKEFVKREAGGPCLRQPQSASIRI